MSRITGLVNKSYSFGCFELLLGFWCGVLSIKIVTHRYRKLWLQRSSISAVTKHIDSLECIRIVFKARETATEIAAHTHLKSGVIVKAFQVPTENADGWWLLPFLQGHLRTMQLKSKAYCKKESRTCRLICDGFILMIDRNTFSATLLLD